MSRIFFYAMLRIFFTLCIVISVNPAHAEDLMDIYWRALPYDPVLQKARATRCSIGEQVPQQVANLLPTVSATGNIFWNKNTTLRVEPPSFIPPGVTTFQSKAYSINLNQTLFNLNNWFLTFRAKAIDKQAEATLLAASQDLIVRVARAYLLVLNAQDDVQYSQNEVQANYKQWMLSKKRYELGIDIITGVYNSKASYDIAVAQLIIAQNTLKNNIVALTLLTGCPYCCIERLKQQVPLLPPCPFDVCQWVRVAAKNNWTVIAAYYGVLAARENINANVANHLPTLSLVASSGKSYGQSTGTVDTANNLVGLQLNVPILQGGLVLSQTRQAQYDYNAAFADYKFQYLTATTQVQQRFNDVVAGSKNVAADRIAVASSQKSLDSTEAAYKVGTRSIFDVLIAQRQLYATQRQLARDLYIYLINTILLKQQAGSLTVVDLCYINQFLHPI